MAENINALILPIGADVSQFQKSINDVKDRIKELSSTIKATPFNLVTQGQRNELAGLIDTLDKLNTSVATTTNTLDTANASSKRTRTALTSLSLVAQDLPFGFIAIQNNLPSLIQQFGLLQKEAGGIRGAFQQLIGSLNGPGGAFLAFSIVTSAVTVLTQKYGSLGNAIDALFSNNQKLTLSVQDAAKSYEEFNKNVRDSNDIVTQEAASTTGQIARIQALSDVIKNTNNSYTDRINAIKLLKDENKDYFGQLSDEKINFENLDKAVKNYTESLTRAAIIKGFEEDIVATNKELLKQQKTLKALDEEVKKAESAPIIIRGIEARREDTRLLKEAQSAYNAQSVVVEELKNRISEYTIEINKAVQAQLPFVKISDDTKKSLEKQDEEWERMQGLIQKSNQRLAEFYAKQLQIQADKNLAKKLKEDAAAYKLLTQSTLDANEANAEFGLGLQSSIAQIDTGYTNAIIETGRILQRFKDAQMSGANEFARLQDQIKQFNSLKDSIENNLTRPLRSFFDDLLDNGKVSFDNFVQLAKDAFKRIAAQAIASGLANLIASLLSGGSSLAIGKLGAAKGISGILGNLGKTGSLLGSANFSGVGGGPLQMAGAVNLQLRGSDLVASINRTNTTINRIG